AFGYFRISATTSDALTEFAKLPNELRTIFLADSPKRNEKQKTALRKYYREQFSPEFKTVSKKVDEQRAAKTKLEAAIPETMVMKEMEKPRDTHILVRGDFRSKGEKVTANVPAVFP